MGGSFLVIGGLVCASQCMAARASRAAAAAGGAVSDDVLSVKSWRWTANGLSSSGFEVRVRVTRLTFVHDAMTACWP